MFKTNIGLSLLRYFANFCFDIGANYKQVFMNTIYEVIVKNG